MNPQCTWADPPNNNRCTLDGIHTHRSKDGSIWATLCQSHHVELESATESEPLDVKLMLRNWVRASGGSSVMAAKMVKL